jgi:hypothetical protein
MERSMDLVLDISLMENPEPFQRQHFIDNIYAFRFRRDDIRESARRYDLRV